MRQMANVQNSSENIVILRGKLLIDSTTDNI